MEKKWNPRPLLLFDEKVWWAMGNEGAQILKAVVSAQLAPADLVELGNRFQVKIAKVARCSSLAADAYEAYMSSGTDMERWVAFLGLLSPRWECMDVLRLDSNSVPEVVVAAYVLSLCQSDSENMRRKLEENGLSVRLSREIEVVAIDLKSKIEDHVRRKMSSFEDSFFDGNKFVSNKNVSSVQEISIKIKKIRFWHREIIRRRFYRDAKSNEKLIIKINNAIKYIEKIVNMLGIHGENCISCPFCSGDFFWKCFLNDYMKMFGCHGDICPINEKISIDILRFSDEIEFGSMIKDLESYDQDFINKYFLSSLYGEYGLLFTDLACRYSPTFLAMHKRSHKFLPLYENIDALMLKKGDVEFKIFKNKDIVLKNTIEAEKSIKVECRFIDSDDSNIVGLWIWDYVHTFYNGNEEFISNLITEMATKYDWYRYLDISGKFIDDIEKYCENPNGKGVKELLRPVIAAHRNDYYRIDESVRAGCLVSTDEALERRRRRRQGGKGEAKVD